MLPLFQTFCVVLFSNGWQIIPHFFQNSSILPNRGLFTRGNRKSRRELSQVSKVHGQRNHATFSRKLLNRNKWLYVQMHCRGGKTSLLSTTNSIFFDEHSCAIFLINCESMASKHKFLKFFNIFVDLNGRPKRCLSRAIYCHF